MNPEQWQAVRELFLDASEREPAARAKLLEEAGATNPEIAREAALLLAAEEAGVGIGTTRIEDVAASLGLHEGLEADAGPTPEHIGRYRVLGVLGDGRAGIVYRVKQENPEREVALKLLRSAMWSKGSLDRFRNEVRALSVLRHENIARIYDAGTLPEPGGAARPYFVMELIEGKTITEFASAGELDERQRIELFLQMCEAVEHAHMQGVIHRDLKPANVLVDSSRGAAPIVRPLVKVIDFGIARMLHSEERATLTGQVMGTPGYMSPEQVEGRPDAIDTRTDVFAAGVMLREMLGARTEKHSGSVRFAADLKLILETATAHDIGQRYQSVAAFGADLRRYLANRPIAARKRTVWYTASKFARRNKALSVAIAIAVAAVAGMMVVQARTQEELREVASVMLNEVAEIVAGKIGSSASRQRMIENLLPRIESFARRYPRDVAVQTDYAKILGAMGDVLEEQARHDEAIGYWERSLAIRERLASIAPDDAKVISNLSVAVVRVGDLSEHARTTRSKEEMYLRALAIDEAAARKRPAEPNLLSNLSFSYERLAGRALERDHYAEAQEYSGKQVATARELLKLEPDSTRALWGMSSALGMKAEILGRRRLVEERMQVALEEIRILRELRRRDPEGKLPAKRLANCLVAAANLQVHLERGTRLSSVELVKEAAALSRQMTAADPTEVDAAMLHTRTMGGLASMLGALGDRAGSDFAVVEVAATADALAERCGNCEAGVSAQMLALVQGVFAAREMGDTERVREKTRAALPKARRAVAAFASVENKRGICALLLTLPEMTEAESEEAIGVARELVRESPRDRVEAMMMLVESLVFAGREAEADEVLGELRRFVPGAEAALVDNLETRRAILKPKPRLAE